MQHFGDLQPLSQPDVLARDIFADAAGAPVGRYSARRSHWRFAVGPLEVGFDRASEHVSAERRAQAAPAPAVARMDFGTRLMALVGLLCLAVLAVGLAGWLWSSRAALGGSGERVSTAILDHDVPATSGQRAAAGDPTLIPTRERPARLSAVIEQHAPAPAATPAPRASLQIADGLEIAPRPAPATMRAAPTPDQAIVDSGNYLLIPSVERAVGAAMSDGEARNWLAGRYHGLVVVGPAEPRDGKNCRQGTVLLRDGSAQGRTQRFERCL